MDEKSTKKSNSFETLVIENASNINELKAKLHEIISAGKNYQYDVSPCLKSLINGSDKSLVLLSVQAISELAKCQVKRETYAQEDFVKCLLSILSKEITADTAELARQSCRALGNLCCDCDISRGVILENNGVATLLNLLRSCLKDDSLQEIRLLVSKTLLNYAIGGQKFSESIVVDGAVELHKEILVCEREKEEMNDEAVVTTLLIFSVINDNMPEYLFPPNVNKTVMEVLRDTTNIEVSELCLEHLHTQAEHDSVKTLLATEGGVQLLCGRLEQLMQKHEAGDMNVEDVEVEAVVKQACDLIIIVLTGDEAMNILYNNGVGEVYLDMVRWLDSSNNYLLTTAVLAIGNFARKDEYCIQMMGDKIYDKLLDIFEAHHEMCLRLEREGEHEGERGGQGSAAAARVQHGAVSALRNLSVPAHNKRAAGPRACRTLLRALPAVRDHQLAYKLLAAIRMLVDGQESAARQLVCDAAALRAAARWARAGHAGAEGEAPRLLARALRQVHALAAPRLLQVEGCVSSLVGMLVASHAVMQNEAILALTLLALETLRRKEEEEEERERALVAQLLDAELGKHLSLLIETNCAKMPPEVAENLLAFLEFTCKNNQLACDYKQAKVVEALRKFAEARRDLSEAARRSVALVLATMCECDA
ncbi:GTPase-GDP dissociation stimulator vimar [Battus philenor]|uniref:GTPase-GDP dissociation stimulator vimar n=1 Tax=Battus philenor TaxID=42288 RepID=UPI0035D138FC